MRTIVPAVLGLVLSAATAHAGAQEGTLEMKMTGSQGVSGSVLVYFGKGGTRTEISMTGGPMPMKMAALMKAGEKNTVYQINDAKKVYTAMNLDANKDKKEPNFKVEKIGKDTIAGYAAVHAKVTDDRGGTFDVWTSKELPISGDVLNAIMRDGGAASGSFWDALKKEGADGFVVKMESKRGDTNMGLELVKAEKKSVPSSMFEIPKGYQKVEGMGQLMGGPGAMPPEAMKALAEKMKNLTPEQRQQLMKQIMQAQQQGGQPPAPPPH